MSTAVADVAESAATIEKWQARCAELRDLISVAKTEREQEIRERLRTKPSLFTFGGGSAVEKRIGKYEEELAELEAALPLLIEESAEVRREAARAAARDALAKYHALTDQEHAALEGLKGQIVEILGRWLLTVPDLRKERDAIQNEVEALCSQAGMTDDWQHAWNEAQSRELPGSFLGQANRAIRSIRVSDLEQEPATKVWESPEIVFGVVPSEQGPTYVQPVSTRAQWADLSTARVGEDGKRVWRNKDGSVRAGVTVYEQLPAGREWGDRGADVYELLENGERRWAQIDVPE